MRGKTVKGAFLGLSSGLFWAIDTILIGIVLSSATFMSFAEVALAAPLISTFLHDAFSAIWMTILMGIKGELKSTFAGLRTKSGLFVVLGATLGGPVGMTFYVLSVQSIGASFTAAISTIYPAVGAVIAYFLLRDRLSVKNWIGLLTSITAITMLSYSGDLIVGTTISIGLFFVIFSILGWGTEAAVVAYGMKDDQVTPIQALLIRQLTSSLIFGIIVIPLFVGHSYTLQVMSSNVVWIVAMIALAGTISYIFYYSAINLIGPVRAMGLNISYSAWAIFIDVVFMGGKFSIKNTILALLIIAGSIITNMQFKKKGTDLEDESDYIGSRDGNTAPSINK